MNTLLVLLLVFAIGASNATSRSQHERCLAACFRDCRGWCQASQSGEGRRHCMYNCDGHCIYECEDGWFVRRDGSRWP